MLKKLSLLVLVFIILGFALSDASTKTPKINIITTAENGYAFEIDGKQVLLKGVIYNPTPIGQGYDYDLFSDKNKPWLVDGKLMKQMGINCVRIYYAGEDLEKTKEFIRDIDRKSVV